MFITNIFIQNFTLNSNNFLSVFQYSFMVKAFIIGLVISVLTACIGMTVVLKRLSMVGDALSHFSLSGVAIGLLLGYNPVLAAIIATIIAAFFIEILRKNFPRYSEISIAIVLSLGIGLAGNLSGFLSSASNFNSFLFGSIVTVSDFEFKLVLVISLIVIISSILFYKELFFITFDEESARLNGLPVFTINTIFTFLTALTISIASRTIGALIISSLLVLPVAASILIAKSYKQSFIISICLNCLYTFFGLYLSFILNLKPGATIVLLAVVSLFLIIIKNHFQSK